MDYDLSKLNDREFELLGASIIEKILNTKVETFKSGRDGGVDGRFWLQNEEGIIQCKHYVNTPYKQLISKLQKEEKTKVHKLNPKKYIFITSQSLSRINKQEIFKIFSPFIKIESDILGKEDINNFLVKKENQNVLQTNYKLWITSTSVLDLIFNNAIKGRSESTIQDIEENIFKYALTKNHYKGLEILDKKNVIILTGEPGIGKTTLANNLAFHYSANGYDFYDIEENISEAESLFRESEKKKIIFYCDDFLGSNMYDAINNKRDSHIIKFIKRVSRDKSKKFILTSRTNILNKAYSLSHQFQNENIRDNEYLLSIDNLTNIDKAQILYNQLYHSNLEKDYLDEIYYEKRYKDIIKHRNYNPRIIEFVTNKVRIANINPEKYWDYIQKQLEEPKGIWASYFQNQTDDYVRALIFLTVFNSGKISENQLRLSYNKFIVTHPINHSDSTDKNFENVRKLTIKSLLNRNQIDENEYEYVLFNPSITDFIISSYSSECILISNIIFSLDNITSLEFLKTLSAYNKITKTNYNIIQEKLFELFFDKKIANEDWDFLIYLSYLNPSNLNVKSQITYFLKNLIDSQNPKGQKISELLILLNEFSSIIKYKEFSFLYSFIKDIPDDETLKELMDFVEDYNINDSEILSSIEDELNYFLEDFANNSNNLDIDYDSHIEHYYYEDGTPETEINYESLENEINENLNTYINEFNSAILDKIQLETPNILHNLNLEGMVSNYLENQEVEDDRYYRNQTTSYSNDDIDAIFERS